MCRWESLLNVEWRLAQVPLDLKGCQKEFQMDSSLFEFFSSVSLARARTAAFPAMVFSPLFFIQRAVLCFSCTGGRVHNIGLNKCPEILPLIG